MKRLCALLTAAVLILSTLTGCGGDKDPKKPIDPNAGKEYRNEDGSFNVAKAAAEFYIDGRKIGIPFTMKDLGPGFEIKRPEKDEESNRVMVDIDKGSEFLFVSSSKDYEEKGPENASFYSITIGEEKITDISLAGIRMGDSLDQVLSVFGEPDKRNDFPASKYLGKSIYLAYGMHEEVDSNYVIKIELEDDKVRHMRVVHLPK